MNTRLPPESLMHPRGMTRRGNGFWLARERTGVAPQGNRRCERERHNRTQPSRMARVPCHRIFGTSLSHSWRVSPGAALGIWTLAPPRMAAFATAVLLVIVCSIAGLPFTPLDCVLPAVRARDVRSVPIINELSGDFFSWHVCHGLSGMRRERAAALAARRSSATSAITARCNSVA
jgi:hypothetical protein